MMKTKLISITRILDLFSIFFFAAIFTVGGGIAMVPVVEKIMVEKKSI